ncbi:hypothetical protein FZEAL_4224 [Fusarium zealandicum]|uniref:LAGLIDADG endonuclease n=1 Tax=Fusarium zealandicum TaxID=1053134 RepID=A0A8H4UMP0_9HYPO|nr:hypothetical protein FZEAL_4224 [Fusarium zealandicum]
MQVFEITYWFKIPLLILLSRFLWAAFQLQEICSKSSDEEIRCAISSQNLPKNLTEIFIRSPSQILSSGKAEIVIKLLPWITAAERPISLDEPGDSAVIKILQPHSIPERRINGIHRLSSWFQGLVEIDEKIKTVSFAHASIKHF